MADSLKLSGPVEIQSDAKARVALDLAMRIALHEEKDVKKDEDYWIRLYRRCYKATHDYTDDKGSK